MRLPDGEPEAPDWTVVPVAVLVDLVRGSDDDPPARARVVAVDGRSGAGKSTLAQLIADAVPGAVVVHTDDLAWHEPMFAWGHLLRDLLAQVASGAPVAFVPPAWAGHGRDGSIDLPAAPSLVLVEGVGAAQRETADLLDAVVWVQTDVDTAERRGLARDVELGRTPAEAEAFWRQWMADELPFVARERPWERADVVLTATPPEPLGAGHVALAAGPLAGG